MKEIKLNPIGFVSSAVTECMDKNWGTITSTILLQPNYVGALLPLDTLQEVHTSKIGLNDSLNTKENNKLLKQILTETADRFKIDLKLNTKNKSKN